MKIKTRSDITKRHPRLTKPVCLGRQMSVMGQEQTKNRPHTASV